MKIKVSASCFNEISQALKIIGREINDGAVISLEKGDAIIPPYDFRMVVVRQNCLMGAAEVFKNAASETPEEFIKISQQIFKWVLDGEVIDKEEPFVEGVSNAIGKGWK
jgi:hypothetical protein